MKFTAEQLFRDDEKVFDAMYPNDPLGQFGTWESAVAKYKGTIKFYRDQSVYLNHLAGTPEEDDFGPVAVPVFPATAEKCFEERIRYHGTYWRAVNQVTPWDAATKCEKFCLTRCYERIAVLKEPFRALLNHEDSDCLFEVKSKAEYDRAMESLGVDDVTGIPQHEKTFKQQKQTDPDDGL